MITELTEEQTAQLEVYRDKWIKIGLQTGDGDKERAEAGIRKAYAAADFAPPEKIVWVDSPLAGHLEAKKYTDTPYPIYGQQEAFWCSYYDYFKEVVGLQNMEKIEGLGEVAKECGWWWAFDGLAIVSRRPKALHLDDQGRLHCEDAKAIEYPDGWGVYSWHGVRVPEQVILAPETLNAEIIKAEGNIEVRRVMIERYGVGKYLQETKAAIVDMDASPIPGGAPRILMRDDQGMQYLCGTDGSTKRVYFMSVPDDVTTCREAHEAISGIQEVQIIAES